MLDANLQNMAQELRDMVDAIAPLGQTGDEHSDMFAGPADSEATPGAAEVSGPLLQPAGPSSQAAAAEHDTEMHPAMVLDPRVVEAAQVGILVPRSCLVGGFCLCLPVPHVVGCASADIG